MARIWSYFVRSHSIFAFKSSNDAKHCRNCFQSLRNMPPGRSSSTFVFVWNKVHGQNTTLICKYSLDFCMLNFYSIVITTVTTSRVYETFREAVQIGCPILLEKIVCPPEKCFFFVYRGFIGPNLVLNLNRNSWTRVQVRVQHWLGGSGSGSGKKVLEPDFGSSVQRSGP